MAKYYNSKGEEVSYYWWKVLEGGRTIGRLGREFGRKFGNKLKVIVGRFAKLLLKTGRKLGPEATTVLYGLIKAAVVLKLSGAGKMNWVIKKLLKWLGNRAKDFRKNELVNFANSVVSELKINNKIR